MLSYLCRLLHVDCTHWPQNWGNELTGCWIQKEDLAQVLHFTDEKIRTKCFKCWLKFGSSGRARTSVVSLPGLSSHALWFPRSKRLSYLYSHPESPPLSPLLWSLSLNASTQLLLNSLLVHLILFAHLTLKIMYSLSLVIIATIH